jgi:EIX receptor 1/2
MKDEQFKGGVVDQYRILSSWGNKINEEECCNWGGIRCSNRTGHVTLLNLPGNSYTSADYLTGKIRL